MAINIQLRRGTAQEWTDANPILALAEMCIETDTDLFKIGNGVDRWNSLPYGGLQGATGPVGATGPINPNTSLTLIKTTSTSYTPTTGDHGYYIRMNNASTATVTLVADSAESIPVGTTYIVGQVNTGEVTFSTGSGAVIYSPASLTIVAQWGKVTVMKTATNTWEIDGAI